MFVFFVLLAVTITGWWLFKTWRTPPLGWMPGSQTDAVSHYDDELDLPPQFRLQSGYDTLSSVQDALTIQTRQHFFVTSESNLYAELVASLAGRSYRVFPNVRLDYIFQLTSGPSPETLSRLRGQVVGFLVVETPEFRPVLGVSLRGSPYGASQWPDVSASPDDAELLELAFQSARLPLLHIDAKRNIEADELQKLVMPYLMRA
ncbi:hypothetical protein GCM10022631_40930 [Deinococcus rubellus]|uniref:DUF2726 domain-containing protein n=1 Tax=Deinococcus rubellus TaxID=1889240 RepID=A0ABY5YIE8_9DEIO|nr:DUF2726 domain-containing protein [Deinococcus rubellus]UWX63882.1 DUF2726 domain-containing protein [Deinococcus rubellus]